MKHLPRRALAVSIAVTLAASCGGNDADSSDTQPSVSIADTTADATSATSVSDFTASEASSVTADATTSTSTSPTTTTTTTTTSTTTSTTSSTTTTSTTIPPSGATASLDLTATSQTIGTSVQGRPIVAERFGDLGGRPILIIGVIHGDEDAGVAVIDRLRANAADGAVPDDIELWLVESMNPDGQAAQIRQNAQAVDLNRNFPHNWGVIGEPGNSQYAGPSAASEPETQTMVAFIGALQPELVLWYHQDANLMIPSTGRDGRIRARYAELTGLPLESCCSGGIYTGVASTWARNNGVAPDGLAFIVELPGGDLTNDQVTQHAGAVLTIAGEL